MTKPYQMVRLDGMPIKVDGGYKIRVELAQTAVVSQCQEHLLIETQVAAPPQSPQQGWELEILRHVRDLLTAQIEATQSL
jgi:hypothetical protein